MKPIVSTNQRNTIKSLGSDESIIIKEADKGGTVVLIDKSHYKSMAENILQDKNYYTELKSNPNKSNRTSYNKLIKNIWSASLTRNINTSHNSKKKIVNSMAFLKSTKVNPS